MKILVVYGTTDGQTGKIARYLGERLRAHQHTVEVEDAAHLPPDLAVVGYDAVVVGAPVRMEKYPRVVIDFARTHRAQLEQIPSAFFSVCMAAASTIEAKRRQAESWPNGFFQLTGWQPRLVSIFAGALRYSRYNWLVRWMMRRIAKSEGASTDTSQDHEYTDWDAVTRFAEAVENLATGKKG